MSGSGISWAICKSAPRSRQITKSAPHHSKVFYRLDALPATQSTASRVHTQYNIIPAVFVEFECKTNRTWKQSPCPVCQQAEDLQNERDLDHTWNTRNTPTFHIHCRHMSGRTDTYKRPVAISQNKQIQPLASLILMGDWHNNFWASACPRRIQSNSGMHHYKCIALCKDISLQRGWFCARSLASYIPRSIRWSPPVLWMRFKDGLASICILIQQRHSLLDTSTHSFQIWPTIDQIHHDQVCLWWYSQ